MNGAEKNGMNSSIARGDDHPDHISMVIECVFFGQAIQNMEKNWRFRDHKRSQSEQLSTKKRSFQSGSIDILKQSVTINHN